MKTRSALTTGLRLVAWLALLAVSLVVWAPSALAVECFFVIDPPDSQVQGLEITIKGSFDYYPNKDMSIFLFHPGEDVLEKLEPGGSIDSDSDFVETRTIPFDFPSGDVEVIVTPGATVQEPSDQTSCSEDYRVDPLVLIPIFISTTTTSQTPVSTTQPPVTTTQTSATTITSATTASDSTVPETTTTATAAATTSSTLISGDVVLGSGEEENGSGIPLWMIMLVITLALALVGLGGWVLGQRSRTPPAG